MVRDRLAELQAARSHEPEESVAITVGNEDSFMKEFFLEIEEIQEYIDKIKSSVKEVEKRHDDIKFADPKAEKKIREELDELMDTIRKSASKARTKLKSVEQNVEKGDSNDTSAKFRMKGTQLNSLSRQFVEIMEDYNRVQKEYKKNCEDRVRKQLEITGEVVTDEQIEEMLETGNTAVFTQGLVMETKKAQETLADIEARHADILKLEKNIRELHEMFMDMSMLIESQGEIMDRIEYNVKNTVDYAEKAKEQLHQAQELQKKSRRLKFIIGGVILVIIIIIILATTIPKS